MKTIILLICLLSIPYAESFELFCRTPTTSIHLKESAEGLRAYLFHPYGAQFTPFFKGAVSPFLIPELTKAAERARTLPDSFTFEWSKSNCRIKDPTRLSCGQGVILVPDNDSYQRASVEIYELTTAMSSGTYLGLHISFSFFMEGERQQMLSDFDLKQHCQVVD